MPRPFLPRSWWIALGTALVTLAGCRNSTEPDPDPDPDPHVGMVLTLNANSVDPCSAPTNKTGVVRALNSSAMIVEDTENPVGGFTQADYADILAAFTTIVAPSNLAAFGSHTDIDRNARIIIFYTVEVNRLTPPGESSFVGGFFFSRDLFPRMGTVVTPSGKTLGACAGSNAAEMFYMLAPDPSGVINNHTRSVAFVKQTTLGTIAHEYQHLINASRRLYITPGASQTEAVWLDEGFSHIAEELAYYAATPYQPRMNLSVSDVTAPQLIDALNTYMTANLGRLSTYLRTPATQSPFGETPQTGERPKDWDDLETRGAIWSFLRWAADQRNASEVDTWNRLVRDATATGAANLANVFGSDIAERFREWSASTYVDDAPGVVHPLTSQGACGAVVSLAPNEVCLAAPAVAAAATVPAGGTAAEFVVIPYNNGNFSRVAVSVAASTTGATNITGPPNPTLIPSAALFTSAGTGGLTVNLGFERRLREKEREIVRSLVSNGDDARTSVSLAPTQPVFTVTPSEAFVQPSWNFRSILPQLSSNNGAFPLQVINIGQQGTTFNLVDGGAAYLRFAVSANNTATVRVTTSGGTQLPVGTSVWFVRTK